MRSAGVVATVDDPSTTTVLGLGARSDVCLEAIGCFVSTFFGGSQKKAFFFPTFRCQQRFGPAATRGCSTRTGAEYILFTCNATRTGFRVFVFLGV